MLVKLSRLLPLATAPGELLPALAETAVDELGVAAAVIVQVLPNGEAKIMAARGVPGVDGSWSGEVDTIDAELGERLRLESGGHFATSLTLPLQNGQDLFGALILFFAGEGTLDESGLDLAHGLATFAGLAIGNLHQHERLTRSYAELRTTRETLERTQKLRALGEMAAGVSHDLKNILNPLSLHLQLLKRILKRKGEGAEETIAEMEQVVQRGVETLDRLREFSRQAPESKFETVDPNAIAREAMGICKPRLSSSLKTGGIRLTAQLGQTTLVVARPAEYVAALVNLIANAIDAFEEGGTVVVSTGDLDGFGWVRVSDNGPGIPAELQHRIFEPFFTTKGREGTGLGLAMVYAFAQRHGGKLTMETTPGKGTAFTIALPAAKGAP
jgi:signal transduction histidine kinase